MLFIIATDTYTQIVIVVHSFSLCSDKLSDALCSVCHVMYLWLFA